MPIPFPQYINWGFKTSGNVFNKTVAWREVKNPKDAREVTYFVLRLAVSFFCPFGMQLRLLSPLHKWFPNRKRCSGSPQYLPPLKEKAWWLSVYWASHLQYVSLASTCELGPRSTVFLQLTDSHNDRHKWRKRVNWLSRFSKSQFVLSTQVVNVLINTRCHMSKTQVPDAPLWIFALHPWQWENG